MARNRSRRTHQRLYTVARDLLDLEFDVRRSEDSRVKAAYRDASATYIEVLDKLPDDQSGRLPRRSRRALAGAREQLRHARAGLAGRRAAPSLATVLRRVTAAVLIAVAAVAVGAISVRVTAPPDHPDRPESPIATLQAPPPEALPRPPQFAPPVLALDGGTAPAVADAAGQMRVLAVDTRSGAELWVCRTPDCESPAELPLETPRGAGPAQLGVGATGLPVALVTAPVAPGSASSSMEIVSCTDPTCELGLQRVTLPDVIEPGDGEHPDLVLSASDGHATVVYRAPDAQAVHGFSCRKNLCDNRYATFVVRSGGVVGADPAVLHGGSGLLIAHFDLSEQMIYLTMCGDGCIGSRSQRTVDLRAAYPDVLLELEPSRWRTVITYAADGIVGFMRCDSGCGGYPTARMEWRESITMPGTIPVWLDAAVSGEGIPAAVVTDGISGASHLVACADRDCSEIESIRLRDVPAGARPTLTELPAGWRLAHTSRDGRGLVVYDLTFADVAPGYR